MTEPDLPERPLAERLRLVITRLARRLRQQAEAPISPTQSAALATIERRGPLTLGELAETERVQPPTITAAVGRLEEQGLVERHRDPDDRRVTRVQVTDAGRRLLAETRSRTSAYLERRVGELSGRDRATLERAAAILERLLEDQ
ncbi:MAG: MarR family transcriptional regulator [Actinobacteria bacterium]|nr:MarR family transcriptional regulator [Actinomycetota bacterium]